jgi:hypothetical protein
MSKISHQGDLTPLIARSNEQVKNATWIKSGGKNRQILWVISFWNSSKLNVYMNAICSTVNSWIVFPVKELRLFLHNVTRQNHNISKKTPGGINVSPMKLRNLLQMVFFFFSAFKSSYLRQAWWYVPYSQHSGDRAKRI